MSASLKPNGIAEEGWTCKAHRQVRPDDRAHLLKLGDPPKGIFGRGRIAGNSYLDDGRWMVNLRFARDLHRGDVLLDPKEDRLLVDWEQLLRIAGRSQWQNPAAGISLSANAARELDDLIDAQGPLKGWDLRNTSSGPLTDVAEQVEAVFASCQGFLVSPAVRKAIEQRAVEIAKSYYEKNGYSVEVKGKPYDLHCTNTTGARLFVEVKGTQTPGEEVLLSPGEVKFARQNKTEMALFVVHGITVDKGADPPSASGGTTRLCEPWDIECGELEPLGYSFKLPKPSAPAPSRTPASTPTPASKASTT